MLLIALAGPIGISLFAFALYISSLLRHHVLISLCSTLAALFLIFFIIGQFFADRTKTQSNSPEILKDDSGSHAQSGSFSPISLVLVMWLVSAFLFAAFESLIRPATSYDTVSYWAPQATKFLESILGHEANSALARIYQKHSVFSAISNSWSGMVAYLTQSSLGIYSQMLIIYSSFILFLLANQWGNYRLELVLLGPLLFVTSPIIEAHVSLPGYVEIWIATNLIAATIILHSSRLFTHRFQKILFLCLLLLQIIFLKQYGILFVCLFLIACLVSNIRCTKRTFKVLGFLIPLGITTLLVPILLLGNLTLVLDFSRLGIPVLLNLETPALMLGTDSMTIPKPQDFADAIVNLFHALVVKSTFGLIFCAFLSVLLHQTIAQEKLLSNHGVVMMTILFTIPFVAQLMSERFLSTGLPQNDTGLSRVLIISVAVVIYAFHTAIIKSKPKFRSSNGSNSS